MPIESDLIKAAVEYCRVTTGDAPIRITLTLAGGGRRSLTIHGVGLAFRDVRNTETLEIWPPPNGWGFRSGEASYQGRTFPILGKAAGVLKCLSAKPGGVNVSELKREVWDDLYTDDRTVQNAVSMARAAVRKGLGLASDVEPIQADGGTYRLVV